MNIIILGSPGVGKGTYTQALQKELRIPHISTGDIFRQLAEQGNSLGVQARDQYWSQGKLVPDELTIALVKERLAQDDCKDGFVLDGFPRTIPQADALQEISKIDLVMNFLADQEVIIGRISGRIICRDCSKIYHTKNLIPKQEGICDDCAGEIYCRDDDTPEKVKERLTMYQQQTAPLIAYYKDKGQLRELLFNQDFGSYREQIMSKIMETINSIKEQQV